MVPDAAVGLVFSRKQEGGCCRFSCKSQRQPFDIAVGVASFLLSAAVLLKQFGCPFLCFRQFVGCEIASDIVSVLNSC